MESFLVEGKNLLMAWFTNLGNQHGMRYGDETAKGHHQETKAYPKRDGINEKYGPLGRHDSTPGSRLRLR